MPSSSASRLSGSLGSLVRAAWASACEVKSAQSRSSPEVPDEEPSESESESEAESESESESESERRRVVVVESVDDVVVVVVVVVSVLVVALVALVVVDAVLLVPVPESRAFTAFTEFATTVGVIGTGSVAVVAAGGAPARERLARHAVLLVVGQAVEPVRVARVSVQDGLRFLLVGEVVAV